MCYTIRPDYCTFHDRREQFAVEVSVYITSYSCGPLAVSSSRSLRGVYLAARALHNFTADARNVIGNRHWTMATMTASPDRLSITRRRKLVVRGIVVRKVRCHRPRKIEIRPKLRIVGRYRRCSGGRDQVTTRVDDLRYSCS